MAEMTSGGTATVTLPADEQILITREFNAPKHLVYRAWTPPELVTRWWSGHRGTVTSVETDLGGPTKEVRDAIIDSGMETGMQEQMDLLEEIAASLR
jgi:hypothetical protein